MGCCLTGCLRLAFYALWRAIAAAALAMLLARVDAYVARRGDSPAARAWRAYRARRGSSRAKGTRNPTT